MERAIPFIFLFNYYSKKIVTILRITYQKSMTQNDFVKQYEAGLNSQDWNKIEELIHSNASVTFTTGEVFVGKEDIKRAYQKNFDYFKSEEYRIRDLRWTLSTEQTAIYVFNFSWKAILNGKSASGKGYGTAVIVFENNRWLLVSEHLGK